MENISNHLLNRSLAHVVRFSSYPQHFPESVAEHSFFTAYITLILCSSLQERGEQVDIEKALKMALVHDMEEMFSGDILGPFKHYSSDLEQAIRKVNQETISQAFEELPVSQRDSYIALWNEEGEGKTLEAQIVKIADKISLITKCAEEVKAGNEYLREVYEGNLQELAKYEKPWWQDIKKDFLPQD